MKDLDMNEILKEWRLNPTKELENVLYQQAIRLGFSIYFNQGLSKYNLDNSDIESSIGFALTNSMRLYDPNNKRKATFTTYLSESIKNNILLVVRKKIRPSLYNTYEFSLDAPEFENDSQDDSISLSYFIGHEEDMTDKIREEELISEICKKSINKFNPNNKLHIKRYNNYRTILKLALAGYRDIEIIKILGLKNVSSISRVFIELRKGANKMEEYKGVSGRRVTRRKRREVI